MSWFYMTCPLWTPPPPPPIEEQVNAAGFTIHWRPPMTCEFAEPDRPDHLFEQGARYTRTSADMARSFRCTTHNRRPTVHQRDYNAHYLRDRLIRDSNIARQVYLTDNPEQVARFPEGYRLYPENWPHAIRAYGSSRVWIPQRPAPITSHSAW